MTLFADANSETIAWIAFGGTALAGLAKFILDLTASRYTQRQADRDKAFDEMGKILAHAQSDIVKLEARLDRESERNNRCERRAAYLERELIRLGVRLEPWPEDSGSHRSLQQEEEGAS